MKSFQFATIFGHGIVRYDVDYYMQALNNCMIYLNHKLT